MEELPSLRFLVEVISAFPTFYKYLFNQEEPLNPEDELRFISKNLDEIPFGCLSFLLNTVQKVESDHIRGTAGGYLDTP